MCIRDSDYSHQCDAPNLGLLAIRYPVQDVSAARGLIMARGGALWRDVARVDIGDLGQVQLFSVKTPDGAIVQFFAE